jgi:hypothetical protein
VMVMAVNQVAVRSRSSFGRFIGDGAGKYVIFAAAC